MEEIAWAKKKGLDLLSPSNRVQLKEAEAGDGQRGWEGRLGPSEEL